jgi:carbohydrate-selective porin OprB
MDILTNNKTSSLRSLLLPFSLHMLFTEGLTQARAADQRAPTLQSASRQYSRQAVVKYQALQPNYQYILKPSGMSGHDRAVSVTSITH